MKRVISLGAGVQSTAMLLMAWDGVFGDVPDSAVFADTGWEPANVYRHLEWLEARAREHGFPIHRIAKGHIVSDTLAQEAERRSASLPFHVRNADGTNGMLRRQCTREYKVTPIQQFLRRHYEGEPVELWIGISLDEAMRMKDNRAKFITNRWPLIEHRLTRADCLLYMERRGYPRPPKSSCIGCPFKSNAQWREMKLHDPESWQDAVAFDARIRHLPRIAGEVFLHPSLKPLDQVEVGEHQADLWDNECEGHCGV